MKWDKAQPLYILYECNIVKERSTMRLVAATTDEEMLKVIIGSEILCGCMDYRGFSNMKGFQQFRAACRNGDERYDDLSYGFVEKTENLLLPDCAKEPLYARAYKYLNMLDREFDEIRNGTLETLPGERKGRTVEDLDRQRMAELEAEFNKDAAEEPENEDEQEMEA